MKEDELDNLFQKFLNRKPNNKETIWVPRCFQWKGGA